MDPRHHQQRLQQQQQQQQQQQGNHVGDVSLGQPFGTGDSLPTSLPSYLPTGHQYMNFGQSMYTSMGNITPAVHDEHQPSNKRQAPVGQWKTPPMFFYSKPPPPGAHNLGGPTAVGLTGGMLASSQAQQQQMNNGEQKKTDDADFAALAADMQALQGLQGIGHTAGSGILFPGVLPLSSGFTPPSAQYGNKMDANFLPSRIIAGHQLGMDMQKRSSLTDGDKISAGMGGPSFTLDPEIVRQMSGKTGMTGEIDEKAMQQIMQCPELLAIYQRLQEEDERRRRRLARNRASARLRRLKKKTLVETFEQEVSQLEAHLKRLEEYKWGTGNESALAEVLGEEKQPAQLTKERKRQITDIILGQHLQSAQYTQDVNLENAILAWLVSGASSGEGQESVIRRQTAQELHTLLQLNTNQSKVLERFASYIDKENRDIAIIEKCLSALRCHDWLQFGQLEACTDSFRNAISVHQIQKYIAWTDHNRQPIEALSLSDAPTQDQGISIEPMFAFGVTDDTMSRNSGHDGGDGSS